MKTLIGINGACGRMGQRIVQLAHEDKLRTIWRGRWQQPR
jgi:dihydrodipicolinate reductase